MLASENGENEFDEEQYNMSMKRKKEGELDSSRAVPVPAMTYSSNRKNNREMQRLKASYKRTSKNEVIVDDNGVFNYNENPEEYMKARK